MSKILHSEAPAKTLSVVKEKKVEVAQCGLLSATNAGKENGENSALDLIDKVINDMEDIKPLNLDRKVGKEYKVVIESIESPSEFYVTITDISKKLLKELNSQLKLITAGNKTNFSDKFMNKERFRKEIGHYALYYSKYEETWFRVKIVDWYSDSKENYVKIFFLDNGEYKCVSVNDLEPLPDCLKKYPALAQKCRLYGISPLDVDETNSWGVESIEKMMCLTERSDDIKITIASDNCKTSLPVTLWLLDNENLCVNDVLVMEGYAKYAEDVSIMVDNENLDDWNPMKEDYESFKNSYDLNMNDPAAFIYGYVGKDHDRICPSYGKTGYCFKGMSCRKEHIKFDSLGYTKDLEETYHNSFNILPNPPINSMLNVEVTCISKFNEFFCITDSSLPPDETLTDLFNFINSLENIRDMKKLLIPPSSGQIVLAQYSLDKFWYRARVLESQPEKDVYRVVYVDYGNEETVPFSQIRAIEPKYLHLPFQAIRCSIAGIDINPDAPSLKAMEDLYLILKRKNITIKVISNFPGESSLHLLVNVFDENGTNIGDELIASELATHKKELIICNDSELLPG